MGVGPQRILGIDPGTLCVGYGVIETHADRGGAFEYLECGVLRPCKTLEVPVRIAEIAAGLTEIIEELRPTAVALEKAYYGKNAASALKLGQARGAIMLLTAQHHLPTFECQHTVGQVGDLFRAVRDEQDRLPGLLELDQPFQQLAPGLGVKV